MDSAGTQEEASLELQRLRQAHASLQETHEEQALRHAAQVRQHKAEQHKFRQQNDHKDAEIRLLKESQVELQRMLLSQVQAEDGADSNPSARELELEDANLALKANLEQVYSHVEDLQKEHTALEKELDKVSNSVHDDELVEDLMAQKDATIEQLQQALAQSEADVVAAEEGQRDAMEEISVLTEALSTVQDQLNLLRGRWKQYREDVENEVAMLDCHIGDVCSASGLPEDSESGGRETGIAVPGPAAMSSVTPEKMGRCSSAGASPMRSTVAMYGSPPVTNSPGFFEEGSVADSSMVSSINGEVDEVDVDERMDSRHDTEEEDEVQTQLPDVSGQQMATTETDVELDGNEMQTTGVTDRDEKKLDLMSLRERVKAVQSELGTQHGMEQQRQLQIEGIIKSVEDLPSPPELHDPAELTLGSSFDTNTSAGTNDSSLDRAAGPETSMRTTAAQMGDDDAPVLSSLEEADTDTLHPASPSSPASVGRAATVAHEPAGTPPDESVGFAMAAEALRVEMEASMTMGSNKEMNDARSPARPSLAPSGGVNTPATQAAADRTFGTRAKVQQAQMLGDVICLGPKALQALEREGLHQNSTHTSLEKQTQGAAEGAANNAGEQAKLSQSSLSSELGNSVEEKLAQSQREKDAMVAEVAELKRKYAKMKMKYVNQAEVQASVNQALLALESTAISQDDGQAFSDVSSINSEQEQTLQNIGLVHHWNRNHVEDGTQCASTHEHTLRAARLIVDFFQFLLLRHHVLQNS